MASYTLANITTASGTLGVTLYSDLTVTAPTQNTIKEIGELVERLEENFGTFNIPTLTITVVDDLSTYTEGFWYKVLTDDGEIQIRFYLNEGSGDTYFFWGVVQKKETVWTEYYIGSTYVRQAQITLVSMIKKLDDATIADTLTELFTHETTHSPNACAITSVTSVGTAGTTTYGYKAKAVFPNGETAQSSETQITTGVDYPSPGLGGGNANRITVTAVTGATSYKIFRTTDATGAYGTGYIGSVVGTNVYDDDGDGVIAEPTVPANKYASITDLFASMIAVAFSQAYSTSDVTGANPAVRGNTGADTDLLAAQWIPTYYQVTLTGAIVPYMDSTNALYWGNRFTPLTLMAALCRQMGMIPRYYYDISASAHRIELLDRARGYSTATVPTGGVLSSFIYMDSDLIKKGIIAYRRTDDTESVSNLKNDEEEADLVVPCEYVMEADMAEDDVLFYLDGAGTPANVFRPHTDIVFYNHSTAAFVSSTATYEMQDAVVQYYITRVRMLTKMIERTYGSMKFTYSATTSHTSCKPMYKISINDGTGADDFYISEVRKNVTENTVTIQAIQI